MLGVLATSWLGACGRDAAPRLDTLRGADTLAPPLVRNAPPAPSSSAGALQLTERGIGPLQVGMTLAEVRAATEGAVTAPPAADTAACGFANWKGGPGGLRLMTARGRIVRIDVDSGTTTTSAGARIGDSEARIATLYAGRVETKPHKYTSGHYLTIRPASAADSSYRTVFETNASRVTRFRAGRRPEVEYVEGCG